jgi:membrane protein
MATRARGTSTGRSGDTRPTTRHRDALDEISGTKAAKAKADKPKTGLMAFIANVTALVQGLKVMRVFTQYGAKAGGLLSGGLSYQAIFAVFAALWVGFAVAGLFLQSQPDLRDAFFKLIDESVPGLLQIDGREGAIDPKVLLQTPALSWTGAIALVGLLLTALGWLSSCRDAVRTIFDLAASKTNFALLKLKDLGLAIGFGIALIVSAGLSVLSTQAITGALDFLGIDKRSFFAIAVARVVGLLIVLALDTAVLASLYRLLAGIAIPARRLWFGALLGGIGLGVLKVLGSSLLGGASKNPLLASFAIIIGLLLWFNLVCQVILLAASWIAVGVADDAAAAEVTLAEARARAAREKAARRPWIQRVFSRRPRPQEPREL